MKQALSIAARASIPLAALGMIGFGASMIYAPLGPLAVGLLIWIDLSLAGAKK